MASCWSKMVTAFFLLLFLILMLIGALALRVALLPETEWTAV